jgi:predicted TIM-barrel fold metal-dependent hydrolase
MDKPSSLQEIKEHVDGLRIIDTHEHLAQEHERIGHDVDVLSTFFSHYASSDLLSAGMPEEDLSTIRDGSKPLDERWALFEPWWEEIRNTGYARALEIAVRDLYGVDGIDSATYRELSQRMQERNVEGLYRWVLKERSGIDISINNVNVEEMDREFFAPVWGFSEYVLIKERGDLETLGQRAGGRIHTLKSLESAMKAEFDRQQDRIVGVKIALAYNRSIYFEKTSYSEAEEAFNEIYRVRSFRWMDLPGGSKQVPNAVGFETLRPLQDYLVHKIVEEAERRRLPIQIHTGIQEGNENIVSHSNPVHLVNLFMEYADARFDLFHGGWPYCGELGSLAKNFPNVYIDMCWMHIISPSRSRAALADWLDEVPASKIMGFGGDYLFVEGAYGHSVIAKENIARVLTSKVDDGIYTPEQAKKYATWLLKENPRRLFFPQGIGP